MLVLVSFAAWAASVNEAQLAAMRDRLAPATTSSCVRVHVQRRSVLSFTMPWNECWR